MHWITTQQVQEKRNLSSLGKITTSSIMKKYKEKECHRCISNMIIIKHTPVKKDVPNVVIHNLEKGLDVQPSKL